MAIEDLKPYEFTSENQPPNESKRVPKLKTRIKKLVNEHFDVFAEKIEKGNDKFWKMAIDEISEKVNKHLVKSKVEKEINPEDKEAIKNELLEIIKKEQNEND